MCAGFDPHHWQPELQERWRGLLRQGAELGLGLQSDCYSMPGGHPCDRWDRSAASGTRNASSCEGERRVNAALVESLQEQITTHSILFHNTFYIVCIRQMKFKLHICVQSALCWVSLFTTGLTWSGKCDYKVVSWLQWPFPHDRWYRRCQKPADLQE